ncbi:phosphopyruvate hydratase [Glaciibacter psychrotolerans]|uniref:Enolase n=1 Tax=Glaciibacter psychrotolerans TaxID=670054 RepID=A0A7Z0J6N6_9MICO|nr:phosphopyruvate hydratase [Leifsonia psychrotolerans]NYJ20585.1 enolase [Leifsonia psychrotolerans]
MNAHVNHDPQRPPSDDVVTPADVIQLNISQVQARQILDSRGYPTIQVTLHLEGGGSVEAATPAGASTGAHEAVELRDGGGPFGGRGVRQAVAAAEGELATLLTGRSWPSLADLDAAMRELDGTETLSRLGGNTIVGLSMAAARGFAALDRIPLHTWIASQTHSLERLPVPHFNVLNGGAHASNDLVFQEFMIAPIGAGTFENALEWGAEIYHALAFRVKRQFGTAGLGDEGGFAPPIAQPEQALDLLIAAISDAGYTASTDQVAIALDPAANGFRADPGYELPRGAVSTDELLDYYVRLVDTYPIWSIEDGFAEDDIPGWVAQYSRLGDRIQLVGDDLYVTDPMRIAAGAADHLSNSVLIKPNQIGTVTQTFEAIRVARENGMTCMISHRSGETLDTFIADLAVGAGVGQIKSGAPARGERVGKYNRLAEIARSQAEVPYGLY